MLLLRCISPNEFLKIFTAASTTVRAPAPAAATAAVSAAAQHVRQQHTEKIWVMVHHQHMLSTVAVTTHTPALQDCWLTPVIQVVLHRPSD
jgi:hypothetical protein